MTETYTTRCFNCMSEFDAVEAIWCSCNPQRPTKVCPCCLGCFCAADENFKGTFWQKAPDCLRKEVDTLSESRMLIGEMLVRSGIISMSQLVSALNIQREDSRRLGEILVDTGALPIDRLEGFLKSQHTVTAVDLGRARVDAMLLRRLGVERCIKEQILPLEAEAFRDRQIMTLAMADPSNTGVVEQVMKVSGCQVIPGVAPGDAIVALIRSIFPQGSAARPVSLEQAQPPDLSSDLSHIKLLNRALGRRASHVQIQSQPGAMKCLYRIDGMLYLDRGIDQEGALQAFTALKGIAGLGADSRASQRVGRGFVGLGRVDHRIIVRSRPEREGELLSVKIIDPMGFPPPLEDLGFPPEALDRIRMALDKDVGVVIVSAPPLSGASSTLYCLALEASKQGRRVALLEAPAAVALPDAIQLEFFPEVPDSFADALKRAARSNAHALAIAGADGLPWPAEAGDLGKRLTFIKLESGNLPEALVKLVEHGYPAAALSRYPVLLVHQRLVRRICQLCRKEVSTAEPQAEALGLPLFEARKLKVWRGSGCDDCAPTTGFRGRVPLVQTLRLNSGICTALAGGSQEALLQACRAAGMVSLRNEALGAMTMGLTTPEEISGRNHP